MGHGNRQAPPAVRRPFREALPPNVPYNRRNKYINGPSPDLVPGPFHLSNVLIPHGALQYNNVAPVHPYQTNQAIVVAESPPQWNVINSEAASPLYQTQSPFDQPNGYSHLLISAAMPQGLVSSSSPPVAAHPVYSHPQSIQYISQQPLPKMNHGISPNTIYHSNVYQNGPNSLVQESQQVSSSMNYERAMGDGPPLSAPPPQPPHSRSASDPLHYQYHMQSQVLNSQGMPHSQPQQAGHSWQYQPSEGTNQALRYSQMQPEYKEMDAVTKTALSFSETLCPYLETQPYCCPPLRRSIHTNKASRQLIQGMESEQRVIGTFERYFSDHQMPVFMLCHYPVSGFLHAHYKQGGENGEAHPSTISRETLTLVLISSKFRVTAITVSILSGNSDLGYIQRGVTKAAGHLSRCSKAVSNWFSTLGLRSDVREVLALPNMRRSAMNKLSKEKTLQKSLSNVALLHQDDLCAAFEPEWVKPSVRKHFTEWIQSHVLCFPTSLGIQDVRVMVGALLCPRLSQVEYMKDIEHIDPIPDKPLYSDKDHASAEDIGQLQLTIDGVTMAFDTFMDTYVSSYFPDLEEKTYRVPPIHFNIQSLKKGSDCLQELGNGAKTKEGKTSNACQPKTSLNDKTLSHNRHTKDGNRPPSKGKLKNDIGFMPACSSYMWQAEPSNACLVHPTPVGLSGDDDDARITGGACFEVPAIEKVTLDQDPPSDTVTAASFHIVVRSDGRVNGALSAAGPPVGSFQGAVEQSETTGHHSPIRSGVLHIEAPIMSRQDAQRAVLQDTAVMSDVMAKDIRADEGENRVINAMELIGDKFGPMFIVCGYQYNNYLNKLREEMFSKGEATRPTRAFGQIMRAEHDCLIFHKALGVIVVCIKAIGDNFLDWQASPQDAQASISRILRKALQQLQREEAMIRHVTSDLGAAHLPCHRLVALPNLHREQVATALASDPELAKEIMSMTYGRGSQSFLCLDELPRKNERVWELESDSKIGSLMTWWEGFQESITSPDNTIDSQVYKRIIGRYCGLLSTVEVWSPSNPRVEVRSMSEAINVSAQRMSQVVLLPSQLQVLVSDYQRTYLYGPPGSGKTMLLTLKAREWLLTGSTVIIINTRWGSTDGFPVAYGVLDHLKQTMKADGIPSDRLFMLNLDVERFRPDLLAGVLPSCCVLMDELTPAALPVVEHLCCLQVQNIWCAGLFSETCPQTARNFQSVRLNKVLRCPPVVQALLKRLETDVKHGAPYKSLYEDESLGDVFSGLLIKPKAQKDAKRQKEDLLSTFRKELDETRDLESWKKPEKVMALKGDLETRDSDDDKMQKIVPTSPESDMTEELKYDTDSINKRLARLSIKGNTHKSKVKSKVLKQSWPGSESLSELSSLVPQVPLSGLPTDGPRPFIIDHETHSTKGLPSNCAECGRELAEFLLSLVRTEPFSALVPSHMNGKSITNYKINDDDGGRSNKFAFKGQSSELVRGMSRGRTRKKSGSSSTAEDQRVKAMCEQRALSWSDVVVVAGSLPKSCALLRSLEQQGLPVELLSSPGSARVIETSRSRQSLFVTSYQEVTGLERAVVVFVPSDKAVDPLNSGLNDINNSDRTVDLGSLRDVKLRSCLQRYSEDDRRALWFMASRCLSQLVLLLP